MEISRRIKSGFEPECGLHPGSVHPPRPLRSHTTLRGTAGYPRKITDDRLPAEYVLFSRVTPRTGTTHLQRVYDQGVCFMEKVTSRRKCGAFLPNLVYGRLGPCQGRIRFRRHGSKAAGSGAHSTEPRCFRVRVSGDTGERFLRDGVYAERFEREPREASCGKRNDLLIGGLGVRFAGRKARSWITPNARPAAVQAEFRSVRPERSPVRLREAPKRDDHLNERLPKSNARSALLDLATRCSSDTSTSYAGY